MTITTTGDEMTTVILGIISDERKMYNALKLLVANDLVRDQNKQFMNSLCEGLNKYGTLTERQREALGRTLRSYGKELLEIRNAARIARRDGERTSEHTV